MAATNRTPDNLPDSHDGKPTMSPIAELENVTALDLTGEPVRLGDLWQEKTAVLVFVRHFG